MHRRHSLKLAVAILAMPTSALYEPLSAGAFPFFPNAASSAQESLQDALAQPRLWRSGGLAVDMAALERVYQATNYRPLWTGTAAADKAAQTALETLIHSDDEGLNADDYHVKTLARLQSGKTKDFEFL